MKLVVCEKNISAGRIAGLLSLGKSKQTRISTVPCYSFEKDDEEWVIIGLKGHIINLDFPKQYNVWWRIAPRKLIAIDPEKKVSEKKIASALNTLAKKTPSIIIATDFDREGELIGVEALDLLKKTNKGLLDIKRAKFSAITPYEIQQAFSSLSQVDYNLSASGESRQIIDLIWGAVLTRFISLTAQQLGKDFLSVGRVQSPTLALLVKREEEIQNFVSKPFWQILAYLEKDIVFEARHKTQKFWENKKAEDVFSKVQSEKEAIVVDVKKSQQRESPPAPFNTTSFLQAASYKKISASQAMNLAEELYMNGLISYPRTDNTVYPKSLNLDDILDKLDSGAFSKEVQMVRLKPRAKPTRGKKQTTDHPPIHPVDVPSTELIGRKKAVYELIVRRFLATLSEDALSETIKAAFTINDEDFMSNGYRLIEANWREIYPYIQVQEKPLPPLEKGDSVKINDIILKEDKTKPPKRYTQGSLIALMEKLSLGTKSTRHEIINKLYQRRYITFSPFAPTPLAIAVVKSMNDCDVVKPEMTAQLEKDMDLIAEGKKTLLDTVEESRKMLTEVMAELEKEKEKIRKNIKEAHRKQHTLGTCPECGGELIVRKSRNGKRFVGCSKYPNCKNTYPLPQSGIIEKTDKLCGVCKTPVVKLKMKGKKPWEICIDPKCTKLEKKEKSS